MYQNLQINNSALTAAMKNDFATTALPRIKCLLADSNDQNASLTIKGQPIAKILSLGKTVNFEVVQTNAISYRWNLGSDETVTEQTTKGVSYTPITPGHKNVCVNVKVFGGIEKVKCFEFDVEVNDGKPYDDGRFELSPFDEIIDGVNMGKLIKTGGIIWYQKDVTIVHGNSKKNLDHNCPSRSEPPTLDIYNQLLSSLGEVPFSFMKQEASYNSAYTYLTKDYVG